jgi:hypothetical protein
MYLFIITFQNNRAYPSILIRCITSTQSAPFFVCKSVICDGLDIGVVVFNATFYNISGGNRRKSPICRKSLTNFIT